jgi:hypothetical protein
MKMRRMNPSQIEKRPSPYSPARSSTPYRSKEDVTT